MLYNHTLNEIRSNTNTGVEYEIALFYALLDYSRDEQSLVYNALLSRPDSGKIMRIINQTNTEIILGALKNRGLLLENVSFETQNDNVGPADVVMYVSTLTGEKSRIGLSIKYANTCTLNVTGRNFLTDAQIYHLKSLLPSYTRNYIQEMTDNYGNVENWFRRRKPSRVTDEYIDLIRDEVISNWGNVPNKTSLLSALFHTDSPIEFWVVTYRDNGYVLKTIPTTIDMGRVGDVVVGKFQTSYVAFYLDDRMVGHMQVKFNNGILENCKKSHPDMVFQGVRMSYGQPFSSWNFNVEK